jgi:hypothetical protein
MAHGVGKRSRRETKRQSPGGMRPAIACDPQKFVPPEKRKFWVMSVLAFEVTTA